MSHLPVNLIPVFNGFKSREVSAILSSAEGTSDRVRVELMRAKSIVFDDNPPMRATEPTRFNILAHNTALTLSSVRYRAVYGTLNLAMLERNFVRVVILSVCAEIFSFVIPAASLFTILVLEQRDDEMTSALITRKASKVDPGLNEYVRVVAILHHHADILPRSLVVSVLVGVAHSDA